MHGAHHCGWEHGDDVEQDGDEPRAAQDEEGECWECDGLYVCDASLFPTASGANPMVTTLATAYMLATRLASRLAGASVLVPKP